MPDEAPEFVYDLKPSFEWDFLRAKDNAPTGWNTAQWSSVSPEVRMMSFFSAGVEDERILDALRQALHSGVVHEDRFVAVARELLAKIQDKDGNPVWDPQQPDREGVPREKWHKDVRNLTSNARLRLIFRTQRELAQGYEYFLRSFQPWQLRKYPGWLFMRRAGAKTRRKDHELHRNEVRLKVDFDYWMARNSADQGGFQQPFGPWGFNSWMWCAPVSYEECVKLGLLRDGQEPPTPGPEYEPWLKNIPLALGQKGVHMLTEEGKQHLRERMEEEGITVRPTQQDPDTWEVVPEDEEDPWQRAEREERERQEQEQRKAEERRRREEERKREREERERERAERMERLREEHRKRVEQKREEHRKRVQEILEERRRRREEARRKREAEERERTAQPTPAEPQKAPTRPAPQRTAPNPQGETETPQEPRQEPTTPERTETREERLERLTEEARRRIEEKVRQKRSEQEAPATPDTEPRPQATPDTARRLQELREEARRRLAAATKPADRARLQRVVNEGQRRSGQGLTAPQRLTLADFWEETKRMLLAMFRYERDDDEDL